MRFTRIEAIGVGPLEDEILDLAPGMNVVHGLNEAGKSSWHAALIVGWLGQRRGRGRRPTADQQFVDRFEPWSGAPLIAAVRLATDDGREFRFRHNLTDLADHDVADGTGTVVTGVWEHDGTADGGKVLGLTRDVARATILVDQADILGVTREAGALQEQLQRAAAAADRSGSTAVAALERLKSFQSQHVGTERVTATKPLRRALDRLARTQGALDEATSAQEAHQDLLARRDQAAHDAEELGIQAAGLRRSIAAAQLAAGRAELRELRELDEVVRSAADTPEPAAPDVVEEVDRIRQRFTERPELVGDDNGVSQLEQELADLPAMPEGDLEVHPSVSHARDEVRTLRDRLDHHAKRQPPDDAAPALGGLTPADLDRHAAALEAAENLRTGTSRDADTEGAARRSRRARLGWGLAGVLALTGGGLLFTGNTASGIALLVAALGVTATAVVALLRGRSVTTPSDHQRAEEAAGAASQALQRARVPDDDPARLRELAEQARQADYRTREQADWQADHDRYVQQLADAEQQLVDALTGRGVDASDDADAAHRAYTQACRERREQAHHASRRGGLESQLETARQLAQTREARNGQRLEAEQQLLTRANDVGFDGDDVDLADAFLADWRNEQRRLEEHRRTVDTKRQQLAGRLAGRTLDELEQQLEQTAADAGDANPVDDLGAAQSDLTDIEQRFRNADHELAQIRGEVANAERQLPSVVEAEEERDRARAELQRVQSLQTVLLATIRHLEHADQRINQDLAPVLRQSVVAHLPTVTRQRYSDIEVDPGTLNVTVRTTGGVYRPAHNLSHGTGEQIYLLLRIALAEHLVVAEETAPLVLDDVTVQFDELRTVALLDLCLELAEGRQVILFTQEREVLAWAEEHLTTERHRLQRLPDPIPA